MPRGAAVRLENLDRRITVGRVELKNRIAMPAMHLGYADNGFATEPLTRFYEERAKGGVGLIMVGIACVDPLGSAPMSNALVIYDDKFIPMLKKLTDTLHNHGAKVFLQTGHAGGETSSKFIGTQPVAPSSYKGILGREVSRELTVPEIKEIVSSQGRHLKL